LAVACAVSAGACGSNDAQCTTTEIRAASYNQSCMQPEDCLAVLSGQWGVCGAPCSVGVINATEQAAYESDFNAVSCEIDDSVNCSQCPIKSDSGVVDVAATAAFSGMNLVLACDANVCGLAP
jgi:hypothetical protein